MRGEFINADCMEYLPKFADGEFDLAITDPPYGGGSAPMLEPQTGTSAVDSADCSTVISRTTRGGGSIRRLRQTSRLQGRAGHGRRDTRRTGVCLTMTSGIGISLRSLLTSSNFGAFRRIKSSGVEITSRCRRHAASSYGGKQTSRPRDSVWHPSNTPGLRSTETPNASKREVRVRWRNREYILRKSR